MLLCLPVGLQSQYLHLFYCCCCCCCGCCRCVLFFLSLSLFYCFFFGKCSLLKSPDVGYLHIFLSIDGCWFSFFILREQTQSMIWYTANREDVAKKSFQSKIAPRKSLLFWIGSFASIDILFFPFFQFGHIQFINARTRSHNAHICFFSLFLSLRFATENLLTQSSFFFINFVMVFSFRFSIFFYPNILNQFY